MTLPAACAAGMTVQQHDARRGDVQRQAQQRREQQHGREHAELERPRHIEHGHHDDQRQRDVEREQHVERERRQRQHRPSPARPARRPARRCRSAAERRRSSAGAVGGHVVAVSLCSVDASSRLRARSYIGATPEPRGHWRSGSSSQFGSERRRAQRERAQARRAARFAVWEGRNAIGVAESASRRRGPAAARPASRAEALRRAG